MPKLKTNRGAAKRFRATANGYKFRRTNRNHILTSKPNKRKRQKTASGRIVKADMLAIDKMLPNH